VVDQCGHPSPPSSERLLHRYCSTAALLAAFILLVTVSSYLTLGCYGQDGSTFDLLFKDRGADGLPVEPPATLTLTASLMAVHDATLLVPRINAETYNSLLEQEHLCVEDNFAEPTPLEASSRPAGLRLLYDRGLPLPVCL
jgi:hypothetical protein